jgi:uncharacterized protein YndB with AHSA1/START domain
VIDVDHQLNATVRTVGDRTLDVGEARVVTISRTYAGEVADVWDALTDPERIPRWFLPIEGDLRVGGHYQLEGNAGGTVTACDPTRSFAATWEMGDMVSWIEVVLEPDGDRTRFRLEHVAPVSDHWGEFGPGAVGIGWELGLLGLTLHLASGEVVDPAEFMAWSGSDEGRRYMAASSDAWAEADAASGTDPAEARARGDRTLAAYTGG